MEVIGVEYQFFDGLVADFQRAAGLLGGDQLRVGSFDQFVRVKDFKALTIAQGDVEIQVKGLPHVLGCLSYLSHVDVEVVAQVVAGFAPPFGDPDAELRQQP